MIFDQNYRYIDFYDMIESGLYFVIVGYYFLLFAYFLVMRYRTSRKLYWLFFSILFLCLAAGRCFFIGYYFFIPELRLPNEQVAQALMLWYRLATFCSWLAIACLMGVLGVLLFPPEIEGEPTPKNSRLQKFLTPPIKLLIRITIILIPIIVGVLALTLPDRLFMDPNLVERYDLDIDLITIWGYPVGRFILNFILLPIFIAVIPFLFIYLAIRTFGVLRRSYALNALGFFLYYAGRITQGLFELLGWQHFESTIPPLIILCSLLIIVIANNYEQLR
ncbi:MAG: hypothetical protein GF383_04270 [Candidatus Lokiarchaeota archaeon]|nr:hypothetical protein [Candidatus Lokiarchaeota archaeon]MBD3338973.1 hypothetical protein [Candidatus Lokiarchaeota archaeon]